MIEKDNLGFRSDDGGFVTKEDYLRYLYSQSCEEDFTSIGIVVTPDHVYHGKRDDPCLCPLALALKDMFDCEYCEVWRDHITIDGHTYDTTDEMKRFIEYFDKYGCVDTAARFFGRRAQDVFRFRVHRTAHTMKPLAGRDADMSALDRLELDGVDLDEDTSADTALEDEEI